MKSEDRLLVVMVVSIFLGYMPWYGFSAVSSPMCQEFGLTTSHMGLILAVFQLGYVLTVIASGMLADRIGNKPVLVGATLATGIFSLLFALFSRGFLSILVFRLLTGLSAGAIYAPGMSLLSSWYPPRRRGMALGAYTAALTASYAGGYGIAAPLASMFSWRWGITAISLPVFAAAVLLWRCVEEKPASSGEPAPAAVPKEPFRLRAMFPGGLKAPILLTVAYCGHMWELYAFWGWIGPFLAACALSRGWTMEGASAFSGIAAAGIILFGSVAVVAVGNLSDRAGRRRAILIAGTASVIGEFFFGFLEGMPLLLVLFPAAWIGFWSVADSAVYKAGFADLTAPGMRGTALGIQSAAGFLCTVISPVVFGRLVEAGNGSGWGTAFLSLALGATIAPLAVFFLPDGRTGKKMGGAPS
jgi:MFS family permease